MGDLIRVKKFWPDDERFCFKGHLKGKGFEKSQSMNKSELKICCKFLSSSFANYMRHVLFSAKLSHL